MSVGISDTVLLVSFVYEGKPGGGGSGGGSTVTIPMQTVPNRYEYTPGMTVVVRSVAAKNSSRGIYHLTTGKISTAKVTIKHASNVVVVNDTTMSLDAAKKLYDPHMTKQSNVKPVYA